MKIKKISIDKANQFLQNNFSSPTHWPDWNILIERHFKTNFYYYGAYDKSELKGICPIHETRYKKYLFLRTSGQFNYMPNGGWIFSEPQILTEKFFPFLWNSQLQAFSLPLLKEFNVVDNGEINQFKYTLVIDLQKSLEEIWGEDINTKKRNKVRKAEKNGIYVKQVETEGDLNDYYRIYFEASKRNSLWQLSFEFFREMVFNSKNISLDILMAFYEGTQVANIVIVSDKNYSIYWLGNGAAEVENQGQGELLQWYAIQKMKMKGCKYYDLCYIEPERLPAIYEFKKGFSKNKEQVALINSRPLTFRVLNRLL